MGMLSFKELRGAKKFILFQKGPTAAELAALGTSLFVYQLSLFRTVGGIPQKDIPASAAAQAAVREAIVRHW